MAKFVKNAVFAPTGAHKETLLDKTTRIARRIIADEAEVRQAKTKRLRKARIERQTDVATNKESKGIHRSRS